MYLAKVSFAIVGGQKKSEKRIKKEEYWQKLWELTDKYKKAILVDVDNLSSKQLNDIRHKLRPIGAKMIMGKNVCFLSFIACRPS